MTWPLGIGLVLAGAAAWGVGVSWLRAIERAEALAGRVRLLRREMEQLREQVATTAVSRGQ